MGTARRRIIFCEGETELKLIRGLIADKKICGFTVSDVYLYGSWGKVNRAHIFKPMIDQFIFVKDTDDLDKHEQNIEDAKRSNPKLIFLFNKPNTDFLILEMLGHEAKDHKECLSKIEKICGAQKNNDFSKIKAKGGDLKNVKSKKNFEILNLLEK